MTALPPWADPAVIVAHRPAALARRWEERARCRGLPPGDAVRLFFPTRPPSRGKRTQAAACDETVAEWCADCPVNTDCVAANVTEQEGVFGSTPDQRRVLRRALDGLGARPEPARTDPRVGLPRSDSAIRAARSRGA